MHFNGFLTNTNSSILNITLEHGFEIKGKSEDEAVKFVIAVENVPLEAAMKKISCDYPCLNSEEKKFILLAILSMSI